MKVTTFRTFATAACILAATGCSSKEEAQKAGENLAHAPELQGTFRSGCMQVNSRYFGPISSSKSRKVTYEFQGGKIKKIVSYFGTQDCDDKEHVYDAVKEGSFLVTKAENSEYDLKIDYDSYIARAATPEERQSQDRNWESIGLKRGRSVGSDNLAVDLKGVEPDPTDQFEKFEPRVYERAKLIQGDLFFSSGEDKDKLNPEPRREADSSKPEFAYKKI